MNISRDLTLKLSRVLDNYLPAVVRDSKYFVYLPFKLMFRDKADIFFNFKKKAPFMSEHDYMNLYKEVDAYLIQRETSLNTKCIQAIIDSTIGKKVLEVGCGKAFLAKKLAKKFIVTGADILVDKKIKSKQSNLKLIDANVENLPFSDLEFDTTICTHTLEHVLNFGKAIRELRRVTKKRLIIVVPMQRPFKYTFDLHLRFFPFIANFLLAIKEVGGQTKKIFCKNLGGDIFYYEDK